MKILCISAIFVAAAAAVAIEKRTTCQPQPLGAGPVPTPDTPSAFLSYPDFTSEAQSAPVPAGYVSTYTNLDATSNANGYLGNTLLQTYDTQACASQCTASYGCQAFNIYFERDPTVDPNDPSCSNPPSTTNIKCVLWAGPVTAANANNAGRYAEDFQVVIAGSNGYVNNSIAAPSGFSQPSYLGNSGINAVNQCNGGNSGFVQSTTFTSGPFDVHLCATACTQQNQYVSSQGGTQTCTYFDTYILYKNGVSTGQQCVMYDVTWPDSYATNTGFWYGTDQYTIGFSYSAYNLSANNAAQVNC